MKAKKKKDLDINSQYYVDITEEMLKNATPNSHEIVLDDYFIDDYGIMHPIKGKENMKITDKSSDEYDRAK